MRFQVKRIILYSVMALVITSGSQVTAQPDYDYRDVISYNEGLPDGRKFGAMLITTGKWVIPPQYDYELTFEKNNLAIVKTGGKAGLIDITGKMVVTPQYDDIREFVGDDLAQVKLKGK
ncbi:MAG: WG repeat-containing protein [Candidatus Cloacimonas sp.]